MGLGAPELVILFVLFGLPLLVVLAIVRASKSSAGRRQQTLTTGPSWQRDPTQRHQLRWWDGRQWTEQVSDDGVTASDPV